MLTALQDRLRLLQTANAQFFALLPNIKVPLGSKPYGNFRKLGVPYFGVPTIRILLSRCLWPLPKPSKVGKILAQYPCKAFILHTFGVRVNLISPVLDQQPGGTRPTAQNRTPNSTTAQSLNCKSLDPYNRLGQPGAQTARVHRSFLHGACHGAR